MRGGQKKAEVAMETQMHNTIPGLWNHKSGTNRQRSGHRIQFEINWINPQLQLRAQENIGPRKQGTATSTTRKKRKD